MNEPNTNQPEVPTPLTDAVTQKAWEHYTLKSAYTELASHARLLERNLTAANEKLNSMTIASRALANGNLDLQARVELLEKYANHLSTCDMRDSMRGVYTKCNCGFDQALSANNTTTPKIT